MNTYKYFCLILFIVILNCCKSVDSNPFNQWIEVKDDNFQYLNDMSFINSEEGIVVGYSYPKLGVFPDCKVFKTTNGGSSWNLIQNWSLGIGRKYYSHVSGLTTQLYYSCDGLNVFKTVDGGLSWQGVGALNSQINNNGDFIFFNENTGLAVGGSKISRTSDGGKNWKTVYLFNIENSDFNRIVTTKNQNVFIYGSFEKDSVNTYHGIILKSIDKGQSFSKLKTSFDAVLDLFFVNDDIGFAFSRDRKLYKTIDSGNNWTLINEVIGFGLNRFYFINEFEGYLFGSGEIRRTLDGGKSWQTDYSSYNAYNFNTIISPDNNVTIYAMSSLGAILKKKIQL